MSSDDGKQSLTDEVKASVLGSGVVKNLKHITYAEEEPPREDRLNDLKQQAQAIIGEIQQLIGSGTLDDDTSKKLTQALHNLQGILQQKTVSRVELAAALSEAMTAQVGAEGGSKSAAVQKRIDKLWHKVEADNKDIDDDFAKMQKAGVVFSPSLLHRHKELMEYLQEHPRDVTKQKELDAVDDAMLMQAKSQIAQNPEAKQAFDDAEAKSKDRHQLVDKDLVALNKHTSVAIAAESAFDENVHSSEKANTGQLTIDDVKSQPVVQKSESAEKKFVRMQKNVCFRTKLNVYPALPIFYRTRNSLICNLLHNSNSPNFHGSDGKFCSKINVGLLHNGFCLTQRCLQPLRKTKNEKSNHVLSGIHRQTSRKWFGNRRTDQGSQRFCYGK